MARWRRRGWARKRRGGTIWERAEADLAAGDTWHFAFRLWWMRRLDPARTARIEVRLLSMAEYEIDLDNALTLLPEPIARALYAMFAAPEDDEDEDEIRAELLENLATIDPDWDAEIFSLAVFELGRERHDVPEALARRGPRFASLAALSREVREGRLPHRGLFAECGGQAAGEAFRVANFGYDEPGNDYMGRAWAFARRAFLATGGGTISAMATAFVPEGPRRRALGMHYAQREASLPLHFLNWLAYALAGRSVARIRIPIRPADSAPSPTATDPSGDRPT